MFELEIPPLHNKIYFDATHGVNAAKLLPGEFYVSGAEMMITTVLGSCVSACIVDKRMGIGGMNHFMLPDGDASNDPNRSAPARYGIYAMEILINTLLKAGARKNFLEAKVFGGGNVMHNLSYADIGTKNSKFVHEFLATEGIPIVAEDLLGESPRKVVLFTQTGRVLVKKLQLHDNNVLIERERKYRSQLVAKPQTGDIELF